MTNSVVQKVVRGETSRREASRQKSAVCFQYTDKEGEEKRVRIARNVEPHYSDAITTSEPDARAYEDRLPEHPLPGAGEMRDDCGDPRFGLACNSCWKPYEVGRTCGSPDCPRCYKSRTFHQSVEMGAKLHDLAKKVNHQTFKHHLTISLRESTRFNSKDPATRAREALKPLLSKVNVETGYLIYHPYRIAPEYRGGVLGHEGGEGDMTWKDIAKKVESGSWSWEIVREEFLIYSPHFHVVCLSQFVDTTGQDGPGVGEIEEKTGVVIHRITTEREDGSTKSIADVDELCKVLGYSLTHTGIAPKEERQTHRADVRAWGQVMNHRVAEDNPSRMEVKSAMRRVAPEILGIEFPEPECHETVGVEHEHDHGSAGAGAESIRATQHPSAGAGSVSGSGEGGFSTALSGSVSDDRGTWDEMAGLVPPDLCTTVERETKECTGTVVPIWKVEHELGNLEKVNRIEEQYGEERVHELRKAVEEWHNQGGPMPKTEIPPDR